MKKNRQDNFMLLSGNEAIAWGARAAGVYFASAYPGTPSTEILETISKFPDIQAEWAVNEKVAYEAAFGACIGGRRALAACKHVGLNVAMDPLMTTAYSGVNAGFVAVVADDPGMHSSQNEQDTRCVAPYGKIPLIEPSSPSEAYLFIQEAYKVSELFDLPVLFRVTTRIAHTKESFSVSGKRAELKKTPDKNPGKYVMIPGHARLRRLDLEKRLAKLAEYSNNSFLNRTEMKDRSLGFIASGVSALYVREVYPNASLLTLGMSFPFPLKKVSAFAKKIKKLYVIEELEPFIENKLKQAGIRATGKKASWRCGELNPEAVKSIVAGKNREMSAVKTRRPLLCPGCPHRPAFYVLKKYNAYVAGDIGCYTLGALKPLAALHTQICMGASIPFLEGLSKANPDKKIVAVIGDSTFIHTGINGLISAAYNKTKGVVVIMDNSTTAMTGTQNHPGTGITLQNEKNKKLSLEKICLAAGADNVDVIDPFDIKGLETLVKKRGAEKSLSVIICRSVCKMIDRSRNTPYTVDKDKCRECGACLMIDCPAILRGDDKKVSISTEMCVGCGLCEKVCSFGAIKPGQRSA